MREPSRTTVEPERVDVTLAAARAEIQAAVRPLGTQRVALTAAVGRVLAEDVGADRRIPPLDNSAMDGFAVRAADVARAPAILRVVEDLPAGRRTSRKLGPGEAARIMTGAAIPDGADAVVMVERTRARGAEVEVLETAATGDNVRRAGSDVSPGDAIASAGDVLRPALVGMLAALGRSSALVRARPRVAVLATGDEIVEPEALRDDGRIASSNSYTLCAALAEIGAEPVYLGIAPDRPDAIEARLREALRCDAAITTGGVSVGDRDYARSVLAGLGGSMRLWRIAVRPGAPMAFAVVDGRPVFALPGNPVSTLVAFEELVRPALLRMMGHRRVYRPVAPAILDEDYRKPAGRLHLVRVRLALRDGALHARPTGDQSSGILLSMVRADALAIVPAEVNRVAAGSEVLVQLLARDDLREEPGF